MNNKNKLITVLVIATGCTSEKLADRCKSAVIKGEIGKDMLSGWIKELGV